MTWVTLDKSSKYSSAFFQIFKSSQMLPNPAKDIKDSQRKLDFSLCKTLTLVFESPVSRLEKGQDWTGPRPIKTGNS